MAFASHPYIQVVILDEARRRVDFIALRRPSALAVTGDRVLTIPPLARSGSRRHSSPQVSWVRVATALCPDQQMKRRFPNWHGAFLLSD